MMDVLWFHSIIFTKQTPIQGLVRQLTFKMVRLHMHAHTFAAHFSVLGPIPSPIPVILG